MNHIRLLSFGISTVSIEGHSWIAQDPGRPGALQIHRRGSAVYVRLTGLKHTPRGGHPQANHSYAPTFNVHEELVHYHYSPHHSRPWRVVFTTILTRDADATTRYGTPEGRYPPTVHWMITSDTVTPSHAEKLLLVIKTALKASDMFPVSAESAVGIYQELQHQQHERPPTFHFAVPSHEGSMLHRELKAEDLHMGIGDPVGTGLMDLAVELLVAYGPPGFMAAPSLPGDIQAAIGWICSNPPAPTWRGLRMLPLLMQSRWCLLVADYQDPPKDLAVVIISPYDLPADASVNVTEPSIHTVGSQRVHVYPNISENQNPDRSADFIWDYVLLIQGIKRPVSADAAFQWLSDQLFAALEEQADSNGIHWVTLALIAAQIDDKGD